MLWSSQHVIVERRQVEFICIKFYSDPSRIMQRAGRNFLWVFELIKTITELHFTGIKFSATKFSWKIFNWIL